MNRFKYLSRRLLAAGGAALGLTAVLLVLLCAAAARLGGRWWVLPGLGAAALALLAWGTAVWIVRPFLRLERETRLFAEGCAPDSLFEEEAVFFSPASRQMWEYLQKMLDSSELLKLNKRQAQYLALQNQINPHFLYNTLESIRSEAMLAQLDSVADMTEALATFFRYTISKVENLVTVEEELQNCETYFRIQQYRFGSRLCLEIQCDPEDRDELYRFRLPKLTLQPILENSIIHGTELKIGTGHLVIRLQRTQKRLLISVSDDGIGMEEEVLEQLNGRLGKGGVVGPQLKDENQGGVALMNVDNRIRLLFGAEYGLHVYSMVGMGTTVEIALPCIVNDWDVKNLEALQ